MSARPVLVSQRVDIIAGRGERRDALDQRWAGFLEACGLLPIPLPNTTQCLDAYLKLPGLTGILLTGGNDVAGLGEVDIPERDQLEARLIDIAVREGLPLLGVCRGMQSIQCAFGTRLEAVEGHIATTQRIEFDGNAETVNSYHRFGAREVPPLLICRARAADGIVEAVSHASAPLLGIMWHPERIAPFAARDLTLFRRHFKIS